MTEKAPAASSTSISTNIAEGKGRFSKKQFVHYCYIARGSLYETMTFLEIFKRVGWISESDIVPLRKEAILTQFFNQFFRL